MFEPTVCHTTTMNQQTTCTQHILQKRPKTKTSQFKVILDECQSIADSLSSVYENVDIYKRPVQARLDTLHFMEDGYRWAEGQLGMVPVHRRVAVRFVKSIVKILVNESA